MTTTPTPRFLARGRAQLSVQCTQGVRRAHCLDWISVIPGEVVRGWLGSGKGGGEVLNSLKEGGILEGN